MQRKSTDPESKIPRKRSEYVQGYDAQATVNAALQVIVGADVVTQRSDSGQLVALLDEVEANSPRRRNRDASRSIGRSASLTGWPTQLEGVKRQGSATPPFGIVYGRDG